MNDFLKPYQVEHIKRSYPKGTRIRLKYMYNESDFESGLEGSVDFVDDIGQIHMQWDNGRTLPLDTTVDSFSVLERPQTEDMEQSM